MKEKKNRGSFQGALYLNNGISRKNKKSYELDWVQQMGREEIRENENRQGEIKEGKKSHGT